MDEHLNKTSKRPQCPVGKSDCALISEITLLRQNLVELSTQVRTDPLTGLSNYRYFIESISQEFERTQRSGQPTSLVMLDIDFFKKVNDTWGHEMGNQALVHIASLIVKTVRKLDIPCRYGGEEFSIILPDTTLRAAVPVAERIRQAIEETPLILAGQELNLTASLGIATYLNNQQISPEELVQQADDFLYQAKKNGRNQTSHAEIPTLDTVSPEEKNALSRLFGHSSKDEDAS